MGGWVGGWTYLRALDADSHRSRSHGRGTGDNPTDFNQPPHIPRRQLPQRTRDLVAPQGDLEVRHPFSSSFSLSSFAGGCLEEELGEGVLFEWVGGWVGRVICRSRTPSLFPLGGWFGWVD